MIGLDQIRARRKELEKRQAIIEDEMRAFEAGADFERAADQQRGFQFNIAHAIMQGRLLEMDAWLEMLRQFPAIEFPEDLPTKGNMPAYVPITDKTDAAGTARSREAIHRRDADGLVAALPAADPGGRGPGPGRAL